MEDDAMNNNNNNKRERMFDEDDADADADEEKKMDKFYELMRKFRQERDRLRSQILNDLQNNKKKKKKKIGSSCPSPTAGKQNQNQNQSSWAPSFKLEDFADNEEFQFVKPPLIFPSPTNTATMIKRDDQQDDDATLNLELAL